jgi:hypothetical protein
MRISPSDLNAQYQRASKSWPFIRDTERHYGLPAFTLYAVGSRETNLTNEVGDGGHGHGVWQLDDRSHTIPPGFDSKVTAQAEKAAAMLSALIAHFNGNIRAALVAYNAGTGTATYNLVNHMPLDSGTANGDYSADVYERLQWLQTNIGGTDMSAQEVDEIKAAIADLKGFVHDIFSLPDAQDAKVKHQFSAYTIVDAAVHGIPAWIKNIIHAK